jgi:hypothetical protein
VSGIAVKPDNELSRAAEAIRREGEALAKKPDGNKH